MRGWYEPTHFPLNTGRLSVVGLQVSSDIRQHVLMRGNSSLVDWHQPIPNHLRLERW